MGGIRIKFPVHSTGDGTPETVHRKTRQKVGICGLAKRLRRVYFARVHTQRTFPVLVYVGSISSRGEAGGQVASERGA